MKRDYGLEIWGDDNFIVDGDVVKVNYGCRPSLLDLTRDIRSRGYRGPILLRFPHLVRKQVEKLFSEFDRARREFGYNGGFHAVFPLKVNQYPAFVDSISVLSDEYRYGLEAGSKAELIIAMARTPRGAPITVNGFKDKEMISLAFIAAKSGHDITVTIEGINELETILELNREFNSDCEKPITPKIGMRIRLHSSGIGIWAKSGGYGSKFGLTSTELLEAYEMLRREKLLDAFSMIHFHIGSQMGEIAPLKKALREAGNIYAELKKRGAEALKQINIGGGLAVEYGQHQHNIDRNYSVKEFANDVIFLMGEISRSKGVDEPDIFTESGRFVAASHAVLIAPVLELFSQEYHARSLRLKDKNPPLVEELNDLYNSITRANAREYLHDALDHMESLLTLFDLGYIDLEDRSNSEILVHLIVKRAVELLGNEDTSELRRIQSRIQEKYLVNFSIFQSLPDMWGLGQHFPVMPIHKLSEKPSRSASIWDITCDSDGEIAFDQDVPLLLHDVDVEREEYFLGFFLIGAYQEVLGMRHNLFTHPTEAIVDFGDGGECTVSGILEAQNLLDILDDLDYDTGLIDKTLKSNIEDSTLMSESEKQDMLGKLYLYMSENSYLKTILSSEYRNAEG
jgi:arginine decarboxylase